MKVPDDLTYGGTYALSGLTRGQGALTVSYLIKAIVLTLCLRHPCLPALGLGLLHEVKALNKHHFKGIVQGVTGGSIYLSLNFLH